MKFFGKKTDENELSDMQSHETGPENGEKKFTPRRIVIGVVSAVVLLWLISTMIGFFVPSDSRKAPGPITDESITKPPDQGAPMGEDVEAEKPETSRMASSQETKPEETSQNAKESITQTFDSQEPPTVSTDIPSTLPVPETEKEDAETETAEPHTPALPAREVPLVGDKRPGIATTEAIISVLEHELKGRWWGWRPNDIIQITDNVQNYQLGVLEVSRRAVVALAERMSRTGSTALYDPNLEMAMNWIMVKAESYWFPSAESKYKETITDLRAYASRLERGSANFFTRTDNLIPLLSSFEDLLGSCDEILLKEKEDEGKKVSFFKADDYFYYSKGVIESMLTILEAVSVDFHKTLDTRRSVEIMEHALHSLEHGEHIHPWIVLNSKLSSIFANHRSNLAGPVSHAKFHLGLLIKALST